MFYLPYQALLAIHEERVNEALGKNRVDPDNGISKSVVRVWRNLQAILPQRNTVEDHHTAAQSTQELAVVSNK